VKHYEILPRQICQIYGHQGRWLPLVGPPPCPTPDNERVMVLWCVACRTVLDVPRETPTGET
jgi:hypothetical protein